MSSLLHRLGRFSASHPWRVIAAWVAVSIAVLAGSAGFGRELEDSFAVPGVDSQQATDLLSAAGSDRAGLTARVVATPLDTGATFTTSEAASAALSDVGTELATLSNALAVSDPVISSDGRTAMLSVRYPVQEALDIADLEEFVEAVEGAAANSPLQIEGGGDLFFAFDDAEAGLGEVAGLLVAIVVLLVAFGSIVAMGLPIGMALFGLGVGVGSMSLVAHLIEVPSWAPQIGSMIGLGVGIDYALFLVTRHREFLAQRVDVVEAAGRAVATAGQAVIFAGGTVVIAILGLAVAGVPFMTAAGVAISLIVLIMVGASVTLLPAFLGLAGPWVNRLGFHRRGVTSRDVANRRGEGWARWGRHVVRHAWGYAIGVTALLLAMTAPVLALELGFPDDGTQPESETRRRAYDLMADGFGPGVNGPLVIAIDTSADPSVVDPLTTAIAADPGIESVEPPIVDSAAGITTIVALATTAPQDDATFATVERLRSDVFPEILDASPAVAHVGGTTASFGDVANRVTSRLPAFIGAVVVLSFFLLMLVFRSVLVPVKAALLNLLSIGASYGVLVMVFQWGWAQDLIGLEGAVPIVSFIPMFMFAILFGLSMDYEVFLLSRVREEYVATGDNDASVIHGLSSTARVITSAALIMISVFGGFVFADDPTTKMFGLGLAVAIFVDATIVRVVLVPATMHLMGDANWWLPSWLDKLLPQVDIDGNDHFDGNDHLADREQVAVADGAVDLGDREPAGVGS